MPDVMKKIPLKVFLLGLLWASISACTPVAILLYDWLTRWSDPPDWTMVGHLAFACAAGGALAYWRKYKALLQLPPALEAARDLARESADQQKGAGA